VKVNAHRGVVKRDNPRAFAAIETRSFTCTNAKCGCSGDADINAAHAVLPCEVVYAAP
jgi:hypothetical protein